MKLNSPRISDQDETLLLELWKWKLLTTAAIRCLVYRERTLYRTYVKLLNFEKSSLIQSVRSPNHDFSVWQLGEKGFQFIKGLLQNVRQDGFKSENRDHDFWVTAIHLGNWVSGKPQYGGIFSEQELRRLESGSYPDWVPSIIDHRPDGWWSLDITKPREQSLIALEVELSKKSPEDYHFVGDYYSRLIEPYQIVWVVKAESYIKYIFSHLKSGSAKGACEHGFILLEDYLKSQWQCQIAFGKNKGKKLSEILKVPGEPCSNLNSGKVLLDISKKPIDSRSPRLLSKIEIGLSRQL